mmetsp:Transcript_41413/g.83598  ORF Transcript_41413/g.83598 Transcript_41413/m.83598 type:complete len:533 (+) Transcript_41413:1-1599(+)
MRRENQAATANGKDPEPSPKKKSPKSVIMGVVSEVRASMVVFRGNLLRQLRTAIQLPTALSIISSLRRLDSLVLEKKPSTTRIGSTASGSQHEAGVTRLGDTLELKLQVDFLDARSFWLQSELDGVDQHTTPQLRSLGARGGDSPCQWLLDVIEKNRTLWFEIGTQFRAIFNCELGGAGTAYLVLSSWLARRIEGFVKLLQRALPLLHDGSALHDVLDQSMFFGASLGRLGADFRPLVVPLFETALTHLVASRWNVAETDFERALSLKRGAEVLPLYLPVSRQRGEDVPSSVDKASPADMDKASVDPLEPPEPPLSTLAFPALAHAVNMYLDSFNHLRQCAPRSLRRRLETDLGFSLRRLATMLARHTVRVAGDPDEAEVASLVWREAGEVALPHVCSSLAFIFGADGTGMNDRLKIVLYEAFASQGLALTRHQPAPLPAPPQAPKVPGEPSSQPNISGLPVDDKSAASPKADEVDKEMPPVASEDASHAAEPNKETAPTETAARPQADETGQETARVDINDVTDDDDDDDL